MGGKWNSSRPDDKFKSVFGIRDIDRSVSILKKTVFLLSNCIFEYTHISSCLPLFSDIETCAKFMLIGVVPSRDLCWKSSKTRTNNVVRLSVVIGIDTDVLIIWSLSRHQSSIGFVPSSSGRITNGTHASKFLCVSPARRTAKTRINSLNRLPDTAILDRAHNIVLCSPVKVPFLIIQRSPSIYHNNIIFPGARPKTVRSSLLLQ